jgi:hypothetical protein
VFLAGVQKQRALVGVAVTADWLHPDPEAARQADGRTGGGAHAQASLDILYSRSGSAPNGDPVRLSAACRLQHSAV